MSNAKAGPVYNFLRIRKTPTFYFLIYKIYKIERIAIIEHISVHKAGPNPAVFFFCI